MTRLWHNTRAATGAEFALVLPLALLFLLGIIDVGRYVWRINEAEKGVQQGVRYAVVTAPVASGLTTATFTGSTACGGTALTAGDTICAAALPTVTCQSGSCTAYGYDGTRFGYVLARVQNMAPFAKAANLKVEYTGSGLGFAGDPSSGPEVAPIVTVRLENLSFSAMSLLGTSLTMPTISRSQTMEDGLGAASN